MAAALGTRGGKYEHRARVFGLGGIYGRKGDVGGRPRGHTTSWRGQKGTRATGWCGRLVALLRLDGGNLDVPFPKIIP